MKGKQGTGLRKGSINYHVSKLAVGESLLVADKPDQANWQASLQLSIDRALASGNLQGIYKVQVCRGFAVNLESLPFSFFRITKEQ